MPSPETIEAIGRAIASVIAALATFIVAITGAGRFFLNWQRKQKRFKHSQRRTAMFFTPQGYGEPEKCTCGPHDSGPYDIVPDKLWGLSIKRACCVHDWMYVNGQTQRDKEFADRMFLENMLVLIEESKPNRFMRWIRRKSAWTYYEAVHRFGGLVFWNKQKTEYQHVVLKGA